MLEFSLTSYEVMSVIALIILSSLEGLTEFLPVSSTGHLMIAGHWLGLTGDFPSSFYLIIQLGAILAVFLLYWRRLILNRELLTKTLTAFVPTAIIGLILYKIIKHFLLINLWPVAWALLLGGILMLWLERRYAKPIKIDDPIKINLGQLTYRQAFLIGLTQALAVVPGVSRSAATIFGGLALGLSRSAIVEFSFLLAIPTMLAATGWDLFKTGGNFVAGDWWQLALGLIISFIVSLVVIKWLLRFIQNHNFTWFAVYRIILGLGLLIWLVVA